jgi:hypothetical protein
MSTKDEDDALGFTSVLLQPTGDDSCSTTEASYKNNDDTIQREDDGDMKMYSTEVDSNSVKHVDEEDEKYFNSLRFNVNVFLPFTRSLKHIEAQAEPFESNNNNRGSS